jgi:diguanylate cyclase (GGDEF)-like protein
MRTVPVCVAAVTALLCCLFLLPGGSPAVQSVAAWVAVASFASLMTYYSFRAVRLMSHDDPERRFWTSFAWAGVVFSVGDWIQVGVTLAAPADTGATNGTGVVRTVALACGAVMVLVASLTYRLPHRSARDRLCYLLDLVTIVAAAGAYALYWTIAGGWGREVITASDVLGVVTGPVVVLLTVFTVSRLYLSGVNPFRWNVGVLGTVAAAVEAVARALGPELARTGRPGWVFAMSVSSHAMLLLVAWLQHRWYRTGSGARPAAKRRPYSVLPYLAVAATYALLVVSLAVSGLDVRAWVILAGAIGSTGIVVARQLVAFLDNADLLAERDALAARLHTMAFTDSLTGLANRAMFLDRLDAALRVAEPVGVLLIDLDDFKPVNDRYGHSAGDTVLVETGLRLRAVTEDGDLVARLGGDEFAVLIRRRPPDGFRAVADRIGTALQVPIRVTEHDEVRIGASVGVAVAGPDSPSASSLLDLADEAMYQVKHAGKGTLRR